MYRYFTEKQYIYIFLESYFLQRIMKKKDLYMLQVSNSLLELIKASAEAKQTNISTFKNVEK